MKSVNIGDFIKACEHSLEANDILQALCIVLLLPSACARMRYAGSDYCAETHKQLNEPTERKYYIKNANGTIRWNDKKAYIDFCNEIMTVDLIGDSSDEEDIVKDPLANSGMQIDDAAPMAQEHLPNNTRGDVPSVEIINLIVNLIVEKNMKDPLAHSSMQTDDTVLMVPEDQLNYTIRRNVPSGYLTSLLGANRFEALYDLRCNVVHSAYVHIDVSDKEMVLICDPFGSGVETENRREVPLRSLCEEVLSYIKNWYVYRGKRVQMVKDTCVKLFEDS